DCRADTTDVVGAAHGGAAVFGLERFGHVGGVHAVRDAVQEAEHNQHPQNGVWTVEQNDHRQEDCRTNGTEGVYGAATELVRSHAGQDLAEDHRCVGADKVGGHGLEVHAHFGLQVCRHPVVNAVIAELQEACCQAPEDEHTASLSIAEDHLVGAFALFRNRNTV